MNNIQQHSNSDLSNVQVHVYTQEFINMPKTDFISMRDKLAMYELETNRMRVIITNNEIMIKKLETSNNEYQEKIKNLETINNQLKDKIKRMEERIKALNKENNNQRANINELKKEIITLKGENSDIKKEVTILIIENNNQKIINNKQNEQITELIKFNQKKQMQNVLKKYEIAIQDYNSKYNFKARASREVIASIKKLKEKRIDECHYCDNRNSDDVAQAVMVNSQKKLVFNRF